MDDHKMDDAAGRDTITTTPSLARAEPKPLRVRVSKRRLEPNMLAHAAPAADPSVRMPRKTEYLTVAAAAAKVGLSKTIVSSVRCRRRTRAPAAPAPLRVAAQAASLVPVRAAG